MTDNETILTVKADVSDAQRGMDALDKKAKEIQRRSSAPDSADSAPDATVGGGPYVPRSQTVTDFQRGLADSIRKGQQTRQQAAQASLDRAKATETGAMMASAFVGFLLSKGSEIATAIGSQALGSRNAMRRFAGASSWMNGGLAVGAVGGLKIGSAIGTAIAPGAGTALGGAIGLGAGALGGGIGGWLFGQYKTGKEITQESQRANYGETESRIVSDRNLMMALSDQAFTRSLDAMLNNQDKVSAIQTRAAEIRTGSGRWSVQNLDREIAAGIRNNTTDSEDYRAAVALRDQQRARASALDIQAQSQGWQNFSKPMDASAMADAITRRGGTLGASVDVGSVNADILSVLREIRDNIRASSAKAVAGVAINQELAF